MNSQRTAPAVEVVRIAARSDMRVERLRGVGRAQRQRERAACAALRRALIDAVVIQRPACKRMESEIEHVQLAHGRTRT